MEKRERLETDMGGGGCSCYTGGWLRKASL